MQHLFFFFFFWPGWPFSGAHLNGVLEGSYRALCLSRAGPEGATSSCRWVAMYWEGGPPNSSSLFCRTCSQRCSVFNTAWHSGEATGRSAAVAAGEVGRKQARANRHNWIRRKIKGGRMKPGGTGRHSGCNYVRVSAAYLRHYPLNRIRPSGKRTWGWPTPAEPSPAASSTNWRERKTFIVWRCTFKHWTIFPVFDLLLRLNTEPLYLSFYF